MNQKVKDRQPAEKLILNLISYSLQHQARNCLGCDTNPSNTGDGINPCLSFNPCALKDKHEDKNNPSYHFVAPQSIKINNDRDKDQDKFQVKDKEVATSLIKCLIDRNNACWDSIIDISIFHGIMPLIYDALNKLAWYKIPKETIAKFQKLWQSHIARNIILFSEFDRLYASFSENSIDAIPLKGAFWARLLYPDENLREFNDFDFLIKPEDIKTAYAMLYAIGYRSSGSTDIGSEPENSRNIPFYKQLPCSKRVLLELHWRLGYSKDYTFPLKQWWLNAIKIKTNGAASSYHSFSMEDTLHYMTVNMHASRYMYLKLFVDLRQFLIINKGILDWNYIEKTIKKSGHFNNFCYAVIITGRLFPCIDQNNIDQDNSELSPQTLSHPTSAHSILAKSSQTNPTSDHSSSTHSVLVSLKLSGKARALQKILGRREILQGKYSGDARYLFLMLVINDRTSAILKSLIKNIFPSFSAVADRHSLRRNSAAKYFLYILTPFYSIFRLLSRYGGDFIAKPNN